MRNSEAAVFAVLFCLGGITDAKAQNVAEDRLRAQLRATTVQLRSLQDQNAALLARQAQAERERMTLADKVAEDEKEIESLRQQLRASQAAVSTAGDKLKTQQDSYVKVDAQNRETFGKLQAAYNDTIQNLHTREAETTRLSTTLAQTRGRVQVCETKNGELYRLGIEVLGLYDNRSALEFLGSIEPLTRLKRVEFEKLKQYYEDKLRVNEVLHPVR
jgi:chromosome segregation ATPase